ncbi:MAG: hypothetical protein H6807_15235 [Planctomycetes bacterium]|nr:hypothetical protein [Planctomycetota bacterium]
MNEEVEVFKNQYLEDSTITMTSAPIPARGNKVVVSVTVLSALDSGTVTTVALQGSYDGKAWVGTTLTTTTLPITGVMGYGSGSLSNVDFAYVRLAASVSASDKTIFDASVAFSKQ